MYRFVSCRVRMTIELQKDDVPLYFFFMPLIQKEWMTNFSNYIFYVIFGICFAIVKMLTLEEYFTRKKSVFSV